MKAKNVFKSLFVVALIFGLILTMCGLALAADVESEPAGITGDVVATVLEIAATALITLIGMAGAWLLSKITKNKNLQNIALATDNVIKMTQQTVGELQQTVVNNLKSKQGGKLTAGDIAKLKKEVLSQTAKKLSEPVIDLLDAARVDINSIITGAAEDWVGNIRAGVGEAGSTD